MLSAWAETHVGCRSERAPAHPLAILNAAHDGIVCIDSDGRIVFANPLASGLLGGDPDADLSGRPIRTYIPFLGSSTTASDSEGCDLGGMRVRASGHETAWTDTGATIDIEYE